MGSIWSGFERFGQNLPIAMLSRLTSVRRRSPTSWSKRSVGLRGNCERCAAHWTAKQDIFLSCRKPTKNRTHYAGFLAETRCRWRKDAGVSQTPCCQLFPLPEASKRFRVSRTVQRAMPRRQTANEIARLESKRQQGSITLVRRIFIYIGSIETIFGAHLDCLRNEASLGEKYMITPASVARHILFSHIGTRGAGFL
jgi:hypothetical protein